MKIEKGATRIVFVFRSFVVKVPNFADYELFLHGLLANLTERKWNGQHKDFARVIRSSSWGSWLIMERAEVVSNDVDLGKFLDDLEERYKDDELRDYLLSDYKPSNWGYINGNLVKIDYA